MPLNSEGLSTQSCQEFCLGLKAARERKGITLAEIADKTKIPVPMFAALERNDLRRWPKGLFRRSFFRDYARMIDLPVDEACAEFIRLFPDGISTEVIKPAEETPAATEAKDVRLVLDETWHGPRASVLSRVLAALIDTGAVLIMAFTLAWVPGIDLAATIAIVALAYFSLATALFGQSPASWTIAKRRSIIDALTPEPAEDQEERPWVTDAHRVGPPRLRVRIKVS
jgi:transcriptional regulator with XRE-family HTH domain